MGKWGIHNYQPRWCKSVAELSDSMRQISLTDMQVSSIWSLWDEEDDEWFNDAPIVICNQRQQLEFCATKLDRFSFSLNSIELNQPVYWCGVEDPDVVPLRWVRERNSEFDNLVGKTIAEIEIIESGIDRDTQSSIAIRTGFLSGIALKFDRDRLEITNGLDCNTLARTTLE